MENLAGTLEGAKDHMDGLGCARGQRRWAEELGGREAGGRVCLEDLQHG